MKKKAIVYIDGYNWYHGIFKHYPEWKWINIQSFFTSLRPDEEILAVKMFSAMIKHDPDALERQTRYFSALETLPKVKIVRGVFQPRTVTCRSDCGRQYVIQEEKKTDVNLAIELMDDAINERCDAMFIVSGDSDLQPAVEWIAKNRPKIKILVYIPSLPPEQDKRRTDYYKTKGIADCQFLPLNGIKENQLPHNVKIAEGKFAARPATWEKPAGISTTA